MDDVYGLPVEPILMGLMVGFLILFVLVLILMGRVSALKKRIRRLMGDTNAATLEAGVVQVQERMQSLENNDRRQEERIAELAGKLTRIPGHASLVRYNAFSEHGSDLSFSLAMLNDQLDGVVLTGIHNREQTYIYAKPIEQGGSSYPLTPEEKKVIDQTAQKRGSAASPS